MNLKTYIELVTLATYLEGVAVKAADPEHIVLEETASKLKELAAADLPYQLK